MNREMVMSRKFTIQDVISFCGGMLSEYLSEPGYIFFDIYIGRDKYVRLGFYTMARDDLSVYEFDGYYVCDSIDIYKTTTNISLKPAE